MVGGRGVVGGVGWEEGDGVGVKGDDGEVGVEGWGESEEGYLSVLTVRHNKGTSGTHSKAE